jgi:hypothetical protein
MARALIVASECSHTRRWRPTISSRVSCSAAQNWASFAASSSHRGRGSGNGRPKTSPKYREPETAQCLTRPRRLVPVEVRGRRMSYSRSPSSFQTVPRVPSADGREGAPSRSHRSWESACHVPAVALISSTLDGATPQPWFSPSGVRGGCGPSADHCRIATLAEWPEFGCNDRRAFLLPCVRYLERLSSRSSRLSWQGLSPGRGGGCCHRCGLMPLHWCWWLAVYLCCGAWVACLLAG